MRVLVNGEERELPDRATVQAAVSLVGGEPSARGVAVAIDGVVVPRAEWEAATLSEGQRVEVVQAVQGG